MSYKVLNDVSSALRELLATEFANDASINAIVGGEGGIGFNNPTETALDTSIRLSLWLYQVVENEFLKNDPPVPVNGSNLRRQSPLPLNLFYLITPFAAQRESDLLLLGKTMEVLHDNAIVILRDPITNQEDELRVILCRLTLEELTRVWEALREPYRLSVCYQIRVTRIQSQREVGGARIIERTAGFGQRLEPMGVG
jgi:hypothetical protein